MCYSLTVMALFSWGALSDKRTGLSFVYAAGPCQRSLSRVQVLSDSRPYFTVSDLRLPFPSPATTRTVTVEVFDPASTRYIASGRDPTENTVLIVTAQQYLDCCLLIRCRWNLLTESLPGNERLFWKQAYVHHLYFLFSLPTV
jgi:hypothetical protein